MTNVLSQDNFLNKILTYYSVNPAVSDFHFKSNDAIYIRDCGDIKKINDKILTTENIYSFLKPILNDYLLDLFQKNKQVDFAITTSNNMRFRGNLYKINEGLGLNFRRINSANFTLDELGCGAILKKVCGLEKGLIIVAGPTGSGKSSTLGAMISYINQTYKKHIITIEDPIEFVHTSNNCLIHQREVGPDANSFSLALKSALREDPDIILIGEMRDPETIREALTAAETGHLVLTTLHTQTAATSITRIIDSFQPNEKDLIRSMLAVSLQAVILQKLIKRKDGKSRIAAYEVMLATSPIRNLIRENKVPQMESIVQTSSSLGMIDMQQYIKDLYAKDLISEETLKSLTNPE